MVSLPVVVTDRIRLPVHVPANAIAAERAKKSDKLRLSGGTCRTGVVMIVGHVGAFRVRRCIAGRLQKVNPGGRGRPAGATET